MAGTIGSCLAFIVAAPPVVDAQARQSTVRFFEVGAKPTLIIEDDGSPQRELRSAVARRLPSGRLLVADPEAGTIRVFRRDGELAQVLARRGHGPGEMPGRFTVGLSQDTVLAFGQPPSSPAGVSFFIEGTGFAGQLPPELLGGATLRILDRLAGGEYLVRRNTIRALRVAPPLGSLFPDTATYGILSLSNPDSATVTWFPPIVLQWMFAHPWPGGPLATTLFAYPFAPRIFLVASGARLWLVDGADGTLRAFTPAGGLVVSSQLSLPARTFDKAHLSALREAALANAARQLDSTRVYAMFDPVLLPGLMPSVSAVVPGPDGEIWLRQFDPSPKATQLFVVMDRNGREVAQALVPYDLEVQQIGIDFLAGVRTLEDGRLSVVELSIRR